ncbi:MAG: hydroxymethylbilane synthase [Pseudonocardiaceae bacterium]
MSSPTTSAPPLRLGTRRSKLALTQARWVADALSTTAGHTVQISPMSSDGDASSEPIAAFGSTGVFVTALREALLRGEVDFVVHSFKDLPTTPDPRLHVAAVPVREDPRDALVWRDGTMRPNDLPAGARIGTGSPRRAAQLRALAPEVRVIPLRGNVDSRLAKIVHGEVDGVVLAMAGLCRLCLCRTDVTPIPFDKLVPAPAQGALAVECRAGDIATLDILSTVDHEPSRVRVEAERAVLRALNAGCTAPVGAHAELVLDRRSARMLRLDGIVAALDGSTIVHRRAIGHPDDALELGQSVADALLAAGAGPLLRTPVSVADPRTAPHPR